ncbi:GNAT family N-acetyltransferase [Thermopolyspora sp. NPDC052614]|uniref:GNAT family N-acetyltransferase n=1 Tax=Thermopolyspora sp. NPDC052614 TaxID=3155682 RepID=UPI003422567E
MDQTQLQRAGAIPRTSLAPGEAEAIKAGAAVEIRPARMDDERRIRDFILGLSLRTQTLRFFAGVPRPAASLVRAMIARDERRHALVAVRPGATDEEIIGHAMSCHTTTPGSAGVAEIAVVVTDEWQGRGIGRRLVERLVLRAAACGIAELGMDVMGENRRVLTMVRRQWPDAAMRVSSGTVEVRARISGLVPTFAE